MKNSRIKRMYPTLEIGTDYFISFMRSSEEVTFELVKKNAQREVDVIETYTYYPSDFVHLFPEYSPRLFDSVFVARPYIFAIEVLDYDTLVTELEGSYLLYKRVE